MKLKIALLDKDEQYAELLMEAVRKDFSQQMEVRYFSKMEEWEDFYKENFFEIDLILVSEGLQQTIERDEKILVLTSKKNVEMVEEYEAISKYQKIETIYKRLLNIFATIQPELKIGAQEGKHSQIVSFQSFCGGAGVTTIALAYALHNARKGKCVLYLNLENIGSGNFLYDQEGEFHFGDVLYAVKSADSNLGLKLDSMVRESKEHVFYFDKLPDALDMDISAEEIQILLKTLKEQRKYDKIIIDYNFDLTKRSFQYIQSSDKAYFISTGESINNEKAERTYRAIQQMSKMQGQDMLRNINIFYNKFHSRTGKELNIPGISTIDGFPWFEGSENWQIVEAMSQKVVLGKL